MQPPARRQCRHRPVNSLFRTVIMLVVAPIRLLYHLSHLHDTKSPRHHHLSPLMRRAFLRASPLRDRDNRISSCTRARVAQSARDPSCEVFKIGSRIQKQWYATNKRFVLYLADYTYPRLMHLYLAYISPKDGYAQSDAPILAALFRAGQFVFANLESSARDLQLL